MVKRKMIIAAKQVAYASTLLRIWLEEGNQPSQTKGIDLNDLQLFHNENFGKLRSFLDSGGRPWFVAADVCATLGLNASNVSRQDYLDQDEKGLYNIQTPGGEQKMLCVNEPGLYSLILRSRKPEAKTFKRWICHEVIPAIRLTGQYQNPCARVKSRKSGEDSKKLNYVKTLRQMARMKTYPPEMRAMFLAEAASLLSGQPMSRYMP